jgi:hypothetical protein
MTPVPRRALIVSADIGQGHNSAGRAGFLLNQNAFQAGILI